MLFLVSLANTTATSIIRQRNGSNDDNVALKE